MQLGSILKPEAVHTAVTATCEKQLFSKVSAMASQLTGLPERSIFDVLMARERLGNTAMGGGVAIPHGRLPGLKEVVALFLRLSKGVDFQAADHQPVDMLFVLLAPPEENGVHLRVMARVSRLLSDPEMRDRLRHGANGATIYELLTEDDH